MRQITYKPLIIAFHDELRMICQHSLSCLTCYVAVCAVLPATICGGILQTTNANDNHVICLRNLHRLALSGASGLSNLSVVRALK